VSWTSVSYGVNLRPVPNEELASIVKRARKARGWSAEALSQHTGVSYRTISRIESGKTQEPKDATITALAKALGLEPELLAPAELAYDAPVTPTQATLVRIEAKLDDLLSRLPAYDDELERADLEADLEERARQSEERVSQSERTSADSATGKPGQQRPGRQPRRPA
jgi:transcriptional regulator with XRE-family HTH domain